LITAIVTATNSQTVVPPEQLNARAVAERNVERFFAGTEPPRNLLYERRSKQYESTSDVIKSRVIDRLTLVRSVAAVILDEPHLATGYPAQLMGRLADAKRHGDEGAGRVLFLAPDDEPAMYFAAAAAYYRLDVLFRTVRIDPRYKPARWHILAVARHLILPGQPPALSEKASRTWPKPLLDKVWDDKAIDLFAQAAEIVEGTGLEISRRALRNAAATTQILKAVEAAGETSSNDEDGASA
jgi:AIPR protein